MPTNDTQNIYSTEYENDPNPIPANKIGYDNTESGLEATTVQGAIDELDSKIKASDEADEITYDNTESGLEATNVQGAIDELVSEKQDSLSGEYYKENVLLLTKTFTSKQSTLADDVAANLAELITSLADTDDYIEIVAVLGDSIGIGQLRPTVTYPYVVGKTSTVNSYQQFASFIVSKDATSANDYLRYRSLSFLSGTKGVREYHIGSTFTVSEMNSTSEGSVAIGYNLWKKRS